MTGQVLKGTSSVGVQELEFANFLKISVSHDIAEAVTLGSDFNQAMIQQPALFAYYGALFAAATYAHEECRSELKKVEADVASEIRRRYQNMGERLTEKLLQAEVDLDSRVQSKRAEVRQKRYQKDLCGVAADAVEHRLQALISIGARERAEMRGLDNSIREPQGSGSGVFQRQREFEESTVDKLRRKRAEMDSDGNPDSGNHDKGKDSSGG